MSRLYDRLLTTGLRKVAPGMEGLWRDVRRTLPEVPVFALDNVAEYFFTEPKKTVWQFGTDIPILAPPFQDFWMECMAPGRVMGPADSMISRERAGLPRAWGVFFHTHEAETLRRTTSRHSLGGEIFSLPDVRWVLDATLIAEMESPGDTLGPMGSHFVGLRDDGTLAEAEPGRPAILLASPLSQEPKLPEDLANKLNQMYAIAYLGLAFLHCKNVESQEVETPRHLQKSFQRKHKRDMVRYHVLQIEPMQRVLKSEGRSQEVGLPKALHICRGHFATYGMEGRGKLFGKIEGRFWKPQHLRGSAEEGLIMKDYQVRAPRREK